MNADTIFEWVLAVAISVILLALTASLVAIAWKIIRE